MIVSADRRAYASRVKTESFVSTTTSKSEQLGFVGLWIRTSRTVWDINKTLYCSVSVTCDPESSTIFFYTTYLSYEHLKKGLEKKRIVHCSKENQGDGDG